MVDTKISELRTTQTKILRFCFCTFPRHKEIVKENHWVKALDTVLVLNATKIPWIKCYNRFPYRAYNMQAWIKFHGGKSSQSFSSKECTIVLFIHSLISLIQWIFVNCLLWTRHSSRQSRYNYEQNRQTRQLPWSLHSSVGMRGEIHSQHQKS